MALPQLGPSPMEGFQIGQTIGAGGRGAGLGAFVMSLTDQLNKYLGMQAESQSQRGLLQYKADLDLRNKKAEIAIDPEKQFYAGLTGLGTPPAPQTGDVPSRSAGGIFGGARITGAKIGPLDVTFPAKTEQVVEENRAKQAVETEPAVREGLNSIAQIRQILGVQPDPARPGKFILANRGAITRSMQPSFLMDKNNPNQRDLRTAQDKLFNMISLVRTGKQGLEQQIPFVKNQYNVGATDPDETILNRLQQAEAELQSYQSNGSSSQASSSARIRVRNLRNNQTGTILESDFDPSRYERL